MKGKTISLKMHVCTKIEVNLTRMSREREYMRTYTGYVCKIEFNTSRKAYAREYIQS